LPDLTLLDYIVWDVLQELVYVERHKQFANFEDLQNVIRDKWQMSTSDSQNQKSHIAVEKASSSSGKEK